MATETIWQHADYLHWPARADHLEEIENHLHKAARLSRALWVALSNADFNTGELRNRDALIELASEVADHASAAEYVFHTKGAAGTKAEG